MAELLGERRPHRRNLVVVFMFLLLFPVAVVLGNEVQVDADGNTVPLYKPTCDDEHVDCQEWKSLGNCDNEFEAYMKTTCRKSCPNVCNDGSLDLGVDQEATDQDSQFVVAQSVEYLRNEIHAEPKYQKVRARCKNLHSQCAHWASIGECKTNPGYMDNNCNLACKSCEMQDVATRCPWDPTKTVAMQPGDLNRMFEKLTTKEEFKKYNPTILSQPSSDPKLDGPWVVTLDNFVSAQECKALIEAGANQGYERSMGGSSNRGENGEYLSEVSDYRTSYQAWCLDECYQSPFAQAVSERIANVTGIHERHSEYLQLLKYDVGEFYKVHHDFIDVQTQRPMGPRLLTVFLYLNQVEEGGGTHFSDLDLTVTPKLGRAVIWPSVLDSDLMEIDDRTRHEARPVLKGQKFGANAWIHLGDFKDAYARNCQYQ